MTDIVLITVLRRGAEKPVTLTTTPINFLSILQIFESTDDVVMYFVSKLDARTFDVIDLFMSDGVGFDKWQPAVVQ